MIHIEHMACIFCSHRLKDGRIYHKSEKFIRDLIKKFPGMPIATGGGEGLMEMTNKVAKEMGTPSVGVTLQFNEEVSNNFADEENTICALDFYTRQGLLLDRARMVICLPGGPGTLFELFDAMVHIQTSKRPGCPIYLFGSEFWSPIVDMLATMIRSGTMIKEHLNLIKIIDSVKDIDEKKDNRKTKQAIK